ncbi:VOC family protein [Streptacidiphilus sp. EB103A]|uniref:VOC family protein n=1 Tax=Streptacidiphilus sp. EB103A TaxID=3156275 RepID=UPI003511C4C3
MTAPPAENRTTPRVPCIPGAPSWVSLLARDPAAQQAYYGALLGWHYEQVEEEWWGAYAFAVAQGQRVAGIGSQPQGWATAPTTWTVFFGVEDIDGAAARVRERVGTVGIGPVDVSAGRVAIAVDPSGAVFGLWQGRPGPTRILEMSGAPSWMELRTDPFAAALFYGEVLDWAGQDRKHLDVQWENERVVLRAGGHRIAALREADPLLAGGTARAERPYWHVSFAVDDADTAAERAIRLGGTAVLPVADSPYGRIAELRDPEGARFALISND